MILIDTMHIIRNYGCITESRLEQVEELLGELPKTALVDRGCKWTKEINGVSLAWPGKRQQELSKE
jgi:hypothetical protein